MKKFFLIILIIFILYIISIFKLPSFSNFVGSLLGLEKFNEFIVNFSGTYNDVITDLPSGKKVLDIYNNTLSGANEIKDTLIKGAETTKGYIDDIRISFSGTEDKINDVKDKIINLNDTYKETKDTINDTIDNVGQIRGKIVTIGEILSNTGEIITNTGDIN